MAATFDQRVRRALLAEEDRLDEFYAALLLALTGILDRFAGFDGVIPMERWRIVRERVEAEVRTRFSGLTGIVYSSPQGRVVPESAYMTALWTGIGAVTNLAVERQASAMRRRLDDETVRRLSTVFLAGSAPDLGAYVPPTQQTFADDRTLRARVIRAGDETARGVGLLLWGRLAQGQAVGTIKDSLTVYLTPGRQQRARNRPEGATGTIWGLRLARTALIAQLARAGMASARLNPFAQMYTVIARPECCEFCARVAAGGPYPLDDAAHLPPFHPHCGCRTSVQQGSARFVPSGLTPLAAGALVALLLRED